MARILLLNGPNLNLLGTREPALYGTQCLNDIVAELQAAAKSAHHELHAEQSNSESTLVSLIQQAGDYDFIMINPAAFAHTSIALRDALLATRIPFIEIHISNMYAREAFRQHSYLADIAVGVISGLGTYGYTAALQSTINYLEKT